ncbi:MAG: hypothetical protein OXI81_04800 [Paracoccaceae bacterium]|nr:hypothetical protein [Paracoccaceae bacterium]
MNMGKARVHSNPDADTAADMHEDDETFDAIDMKAGGSLTCSESTDWAGCTVQKISEGHTLGEGWTFTPKSGAMLSMKDGMCLYFGWRLRDDAKGPTHAGEFYGVVPASGETGALSVTDSFNLSGNATYRRMSAGKFAIDNSFGSASDAGQFTADANLIARFGATTDANSNGLTGTIDDYWLNGGSAEPGWSVSTKRGRWNGPDSADELMANAGTDTADDTAIDGTADEWSIGSTALPNQTGRWEARLFNERDGGSNVPTTAAEMFRAGFGQSPVHLSRKPVGGMTPGPPMSAVTGSSVPPTRTSANGGNGCIQSPTVPGQSSTMRSGPAWTRPQSLSDPLERDAQVFADIDARRSRETW